MIKLNLYSVAISCIIVGAMAFEPRSRALIFQRPNSKTASPVGFRDSQYAHKDRIATKLRASFLSTTLVAVDSLWKGYPYVAAAVTCGVKASAADLIAQNRQFRKEQVLDRDVDVENAIITFEPPEQKTDYLRNFAYIVCEYTIPISNLLAH
jgi:hypothetical protein